MGQVAWQRWWMEQYGGVVLSKKFAVKPALLGGLCLLCAFLLAWISPKEGVAGLLGMGSRDGLATEGVRTKVRERDDAEGREVRSVAEEYMMKAERGMTEDEVRWVVEDFLALGLDVEYPEDTTAEGYLALRKAREDWYLGALVSGLRLTTEQEREAKAAMGVLRERDYAEFVEYLYGVKSFEDEGQEMKVVDGAKAWKLMDAGNWVEGEGCRPWELCELTDEQLAVTWEVGENATSEPLNEDLWEGFSGFGFWKDVGGEPIPIEGFTVDPFSTLNWELVASSGTVFPFSERQAKLFQKIDSEDERLTALELATLLSPEQLKMLLLLSRGVVMDIKVESKKPSE